MYFDAFRRISADFDGFWRVLTDLLRTLARHRRPVFGPCALLAELCGGHVLARHVPEGDRPEGGTAGPGIR